MPVQRLDRHGSLAHACAGRWSYDDRVVYLVGCVVKRVRRWNIFGKFRFRVSMPASVRVEYIRGWSVWRGARMNEIDTHLTWSTTPPL